MDHQELAQMNLMQMKEDREFQHLKKISVICTASSIVITAM